MTKEVDFNNDIIRITNEVLSDGTVDEIIREKVVKGFTEAIDSAFHWGALNDAIKKRVKDVLVPYIESYSMGRYVIKLDETLSQIIETTALIDNKRILENFKDLMVEPTEKQVTLEQMFKQYCKYVAENVDTFDLEVDYDDGVRYQSVTAYAEIIHDEEPRWGSGSFKHATLHFQTEKQEKLTFSVRLCRYTHDRNEGYGIRFDSVPTITGLAGLNDFEVYLSRLTRADVNLVWDDEELEEYVNPEAEPEPHFS